MTLVDLVAALMFIGVIAYALFGGADFGTGLWDLTAGGDRTGGPLRAQIDRSLGPVWEANHVWLIYILVFLWTAFPTGFAAMMRTLFVPFLLAGLGIVLRGAAFAFRKFSATLRAARLHGVVFASSSILTPFVFGMIVGAIASGRVPAEDTGDLWRSWTGPTSWIGGVLAMLTCAFLAATYLAADADRAGDGDLARSVGAKALWSGVVTGVAAIAAAITIELDAETLAGNLHTRGLPLVIISAGCGAVSLWLLSQQQWAWARVAAAGAVAAIVVGWGVAQYPDLLVDELTLADAAGADATLVGLVIVFALAAVTAVPSLIWLYVLVNQPSWWGRRPSTEG